MPVLLALSGLIDRINTVIGKTAMWLVLVTTFISAGNAIVRKAFDMSSNALLEVQWYLFAGVFMLAAGYALLQNAHVRIDFIASRLSPRTRNWIDVIGILVVLAPFCLISIYLSWPLFVNALNSGEMSNNAGGLIRWPVYLLVPVGFGLLLLQGISELIKRIAFLRGAGPDTLATHETEEEKLARELAGQAEPRAAAESK
ncbi:TRAP transporter small permease subunit [Ramlibacter rhizophilus]|uniref:TRAP transporter small permease protein n=1 Tax=Ramlibacter rhizophilus TaxID=1781167 RepID=A0A4Z0BG28_9BURK|nr:TRAP transporter small permease subunit [Ramlibacter rhizophilus]TFY96838.1 TRAP transporter small permease subunit [Ramlibacter rhizophilus]